jgi:hypothetical protein
MGIKAFDFDFEERGFFLCGMILRREVSFRVE